MKRLKAILAILLLTLTFMSCEEETIEPKTDATEESDSSGGIDGDSSTFY